MSDMTFVCWRPFNCALEQWRALAQQDARHAVIAWDAQEAAEDFVEEGIARGDIEPTAEEVQVRVRAPDGVVTDWRVAVDRERTYTAIATDEWGKEIRAAPFVAQDDDDELEDEAA